MAGARRMVAAIAAALAVAAGAAAQPTQDPRVADLVSSGSLKVGLFASQFVRSPATREIAGVRVDIARALATRIGVRAQFVELAAPRDAVACLAASACDVIFLPRDERAASAGLFSHPIIESQYTMLVPAGSAVLTPADADRPGARIAAVKGHASAATLARITRTATILARESEDAAFELLRVGQADVLASTRQSLLKLAPRLPGSRVLEASYGANINRLVVAKGRDGFLAFVDAFVEEAKASGLVRQAIDRDPTQAFTVAPAGDGNVGGIGEGAGPK